MNCLECKERLFPENPELPFYDPYAKRYLTPICLGCNAHQKEEADLNDRIGNLEEISAQAGRIPRAYYDRFKRMQGELAYLHNKVYGESTKPVKKPSYQGLRVNDNES